jgi:leucyl-tRNA synthetase
MVRTNFAKIEKKWQERWEKAKIFEVKENPKKKKFYVLEMYPYPSASGLHIGHAFNYTIGDIYARFKRMQGFNVLYPMGYDSFGLPAENAAIRNKSHPKKFTEEAIKNYIKQQRSLGLSYDWSRKVECHRPDFYKWDQWIFLQMFKKGLAYKKTAPANWCKKCNTVLANEQVKDGRCYLHEDTEVEIKHLEQWFLKITKYADELYESIDGLRDWPEDIKAMQKNWIGKSHGYEIEFEINGKKWPIFTTRPDTLFGVTFMVVSAQHPRLHELITKEQKKEVDAFLKKIKSTSQKDIEELEKEGAFTGSYAVNPATGEKVPVWAGNFVVADYGAGMVMAVPAHDQRDFEFAKKYEIPIKPVVLKKHDESFSYVVGIDEKNITELGAKIIEKTKDGFFKIKIPFSKLEDYKEFIRINLSPGFWNEFSTENGFYFIFKHKNGKIEEFELNEKTNDVIDKYGMTFNGEEPKEIPENVYSWLAKNDFYEEILIHTEEGVLINSGKFNGLKSKEAIGEIGKKFGKKVVNFKLRDWLVSRQRFWGTPIPIVYCDECGVVPVPEKELPVVLPDDVKFSSERNPLIGDDKFVKTKCPKCSGDARRETDTMDTFVNSSWYFLRYCDPHNEKEIFDKKKVKQWMPVDLYIGGREHATGHLIYCRFYIKFLRDIGLVDFDEPATRLFNQGMVQGPGGEKMSKSKGNVVLPETVSEKYGIDSARIFLVSLGGLDRNRDWSDRGAEGSLRFIEKVVDFVENVKVGKSNSKTEHKVNKAIRDVTLDIDTMRYNMAVIKLRELVESLDSEIAKKDLENFIKLFAPFAPHVAEELWEKIENKPFVSLTSWPEFDAKKINEDFDKQEQLFEKTVADILNILKIVSKSEKVYLYVLPNEIEIYSAEEIGKRVGKKVRVFAVNDKNKYDPQGKSAKAKPGKPAIFVE